MPGPPYRPAPPWRGRREGRGSAGTGPAEPGHGRRHSRDGNAECGAGQEEPLPGALEPDGVHGVLGTARVKAAGRRKQGPEQPLVSVDDGDERRAQHEVGLSHPVVLPPAPVLRPDGPIELATNFPQRHGPQGPLRDDDVVAGRGESILGGPEVFAEQPLDPVPNDGVPDLPTRGNSQATPSELIVGEIDDEVGRGSPRAPRGGPPVVTAQEKPLILRKPPLPGGATSRGAPAAPPKRRRSYFLATRTVSRLRPLARLRFSTARPAAVLMRLRKPCVVFLLRLCGW